MWNQNDLGLSGNTLTHPFGQNGPMQSMFSYVSFPLDIKLTRMGMKVGRAYGTSSSGNWVDSGKFYGRYCIWDSNGILLDMTGVVVQSATWQYGDKPFTYGNFIYKTTLKKGVRYRIGFVRAASSVSLGASVTCFRYGLAASSRAYIQYTSSTKLTEASINAGAPNINGYSYYQYWNNSRYLGLVFEVSYIKAEVGAKQWSDSEGWFDKGVKKWNGDQWVSSPVKKWSGSQWNEIT